MTASTRIQWSSLRQNDLVNKRMEEILYTAQEHECDMTNRHQVLDCAARVAKGSTKGSNSLEPGNIPPEMAHGTSSPGSCFHRPPPPLPLSEMQTRA